MASQLILYCPTEQAQIARATLTCLFTEPLEPALSYLQLQRCHSSSQEMISAREERLRTDRLSALKRWHVEYVRFCSYSHILVAKLVLGRLQSDTSGVPMQMRRKAIEKEVGARSGDHLSCYGVWLGRD